MIIAVIGLIMIFGICPMLIGKIVLGDTSRRSSFYIYISGFICMLAVFHILCMLAIWQEFPFHILTYMYTVIISALLVLCIFRYRNEISGIKIRMPNIRKNLLLYICLGLILAQIIWQCSHTPYIYGDDFSYITMINDIVESDTIYGINYRTGQVHSVYETMYKYLLTSYYPFLAMVATICKIHPLILCKTLLPILFIPISYMVVWELAKYFFGNSIHRATYFLYFYLVLNFFGAFSWYSASFRSWTWIWQSKAILAIIILPFCFLVAVKTFGKRMHLDDMVVLTLIVTAACGTTMMGVGLASIMVLTIATIYTIERKNIYVFLKGLICCIPAIVSAFICIIIK